MDGRAAAPSDVRGRVPPFAMGGRDGTASPYLRARRARRAAALPPSRAPLQAAPPGAVAVADADGRRRGGGEGGATVATWCRMASALTYASSQKTGRTAAGDGAVAVAAAGTAVTATVETSTVATIAGPRPW